jgi:Capsular polysaccharide synthesis protein
MHTTHPTIWMLWLQGWDNAPAIVRACLESWRGRNPGWRVEALDANTVGDAMLPEDRGLLSRAKT